jgi:hypothetical protein
MIGRVGVRRATSVKPALRKVDAEFRPPSGLGGQ